MFEIAGWFLLGFVLGAVAGGWAWAKYKAKVAADLQKAANKASTS